MRPLAGLLVCVSCFGQSPPTPPLSEPELRLERLRTAATGLLSKLPDITCTLTIERFSRPNSRRKFDIIDRLRLEVGLINGKELYAWPGSRSFEDRDLIDLVVPRLGALGTGDFAAHARSIILSGHSTLTFERADTNSGRAIDRWRFHQPIATSRHHVRIASSEGFVGYSGTLRADSVTGDLIRIEMDLNEVPPQLPLKRGLRTITYQRVPIGEASFLLPKTSDLILIHRNGFESRNHSSFSDCRHFTAQSTLSFDDAAPGPTANPRNPSPPISLPGGLALYLRPAAPIDFSLLAIGDPIQLIAERDTVSGGQVRLPAGAFVTGRVLSLECHDAPVKYCLAQVRLESFKAGNMVGNIRATLASPSLSEQMAPVNREIDRRGKVRGFRVNVSSWPGLSPVFVYQKRWKPSDITVWLTL